MSAVTEVIGPFQHLTSFGTSLWTNYQLNSEIMIHDQYFCPGVILKRSTMKDLEGWPLTAF